MLSAMTPTIVLDSTVARSSRRRARRTADHNRDDAGDAERLAYDMSLADAVGAPRIHHQAIPDSLEAEPGALSAAVADTLRAWGWAIVPTGSVGTRGRGDARRAAGSKGIDDPRHGARAVGY